MSFERHIILVSLSFARYVPSHHLQKYHTRVNYCKTPASSERVSEVALFQGHSPCAWRRPEDVPQARTQTPEIWGTIWDEWP